MPYVHEQVGGVERRWGVLQAIARTMMIRAKVSLKLWAEAMLHATWLLNRQADRTRGEEGEVSTPYERMFGSKPDLSKARVCQDRVGVAQSAQLIHL